jgi:Putative lumazine-binding
MTDLDEIRSTIQNYFDGLYHGDIERMQRAFHPCCHLYSGMEGGIQDESAPDWFRRIQNRASPASEGALRRDRIVFIDLNGSGSALVKVQVQAPSGRYSDYLSMLKLLEGWRIVAKVFAPYDEGH